MLTTRLPQRQVTRFARPVMARGVRLSSPPTHVAPPTTKPETTPKKIPTPQQALDLQGEFVPHMASLITKHVEDFKDQSTEHLYPVTAKPKSMKRIIRKIFAKGKWPINDVYRSTVVFDNFHDLRGFRQHLLDHGPKLITEADYFEKPLKSGHMFHKMVFEVEFDGFVFPIELQLQLDEIWKLASSTEDHYMYESTQAPSTDPGFVDRIKAAQRQEFKRAAARYFKSRIV